MLVAASATSRPARPARRSPPATRRVQNVVEKHARTRRDHEPPSRLARLVATQEIFEGEQVSTRRFGTIAADAASGPSCTGTLRGFEVDGDPNQMLAGTLKAGDHVDLVATLKQGSKLRPAQPRRPAEPQGAAGAAIARPRARRSPAAAAGLQRDPRRSPTARRRSSSSSSRRPRDSGGSGGGTTWRLALRPPLKDDDSPDHLDSVQTVLGDGIPGPAQRSARVRPLRCPERTETMENLTDRNRVRVYVDRRVRGPPELSRALAGHPEIELVGSSEQVRRGRRRPSPAGTCRCVLHATRASSLPADELAAIREHTRAPVILLASGESLAAARGGARRRRRRRAAAAAAGRERRLRDPQGGARRPAATPAAAGRKRPDRDRVLAEGRDGQDRDRDEPRRRAREARGQADAAARPRPAVRRRRDHARARAREDDLRPRRRPGRARLGEARRLHDAATRAGSTSSRRRCARRTPSS